MSNDRIVTLAGGVGAAKFLRGLIEITDPSSCSAIINTADDFVLHGLNISPDIDTVTYTVSDHVNPETGWGRRDETWTVMAELERLGGEAWFSLGDRDLALHLHRTNRRARLATRRPRPDASRSRRPRGASRWPTRLR